jgi:hypothetical protein
MIKAVVTGSAPSQTLGITVAPLIGQLANALLVARAVATPAFQVDTSTTLSILGLKLTAGASGGLVALDAIGETNVAASLNSKGSGTLHLNNTATGKLIACVGGGNFGIGADPGSSIRFLMRAAADRNFRLMDDSLVFGTDGVLFSVINNAFDTPKTIVFQGSLYRFTSATVLLAASASGYSSLRIPAGSAPSSPTDGDMWYDGTNLKFRAGGTTRTVTWT